MSAISVHHTAVDSSSTWDRSKVTATGKAELRYVSAWVDSTADAELIGSYKLMHHYRDGGPAILAGVNNAKARLSQTDMPQSDRAGVLSHLNAHQSDAKQSILQTIRGWFEHIFGGNETETNERAISMPNIYQLVYAALDNLNLENSDNPANPGMYVGLVDVYVNGLDMYAVLAVDGLLYRSDITLTDLGVTLAPPVAIVVDHRIVETKPAAQSLKTTRQADGKYRWFAFPAATAVLNRSGELDSRQLFESFVTRIESKEVPYPYLSFYHVGEAIKLGLADYVAVDGYTLLMSGLWDDEPLAQAVREAIEKTPDYYGISIGYMYAPETKKELQVGDGITIPLYTDGILFEASILAEPDASCLMTGAYTEGVNRMNKKAKDELEKIVAGDPALEAQVAELEAHVDSVNASTEGLIRREGTEVAPTEPVAETPLAGTGTGDKPIPVTPIEVPIDFVMTDEAMTNLSARVATSAAVTFADQLTAANVKHEQAITDLAAQIAQLVGRIAKLEAPLEETVQQALQDMPRKITQNLAVGYRPRQKNQAEQPEEISTEDVAQETLANIKKQ